MSADERAAFETRYAEDAAFRESYTKWLSEVSPRTQGDRRSFWWSGPWVWAGAAAAGALCALVVVVWLVRGTAPGGPELFAVLVPSNSEFGFEVRYDIDADRLLVNATEFGPISADVIQTLWLVPDGSDDIVFLGVLEADGSGSVTFPAERAGTLNAAVLVVTHEPAGDSFTGTPLGPAVAAGAVGRQE